MLLLAFAQAPESVVAEPLLIPYLPTALWALVTGMSLVLVLVAFGIYLWYRKRVEAVIEDASTVANLAAQKGQLEAEIEQCRNWLKDNREELLKLDAERREQELLRQELARLQMESAQTEQRQDELRKEASDFQNIVSTLAQDRDRLIAEKAALDKAKEEAEAATRAAEEERQRADTEAKQATQGKRASEALYNEEKERLDQLVQDMADKEVRRQLLMREVTALTETRAAWQEELLKLEAERRLQEDLRKKLDDLRREVTQQEQEINSLRRAASELQSAVSTLSQDRDRLATETAILDRERTAVEATAKEAEVARQRAVGAAKQADEERQSLIERYKEEQRRRDEILRDISDKEIKMQSLTHEITALTGRRADLHAQDGHTSDDSYVDLLTGSPECLREDVFPGGQIGQRDEEEALAELQRHLRANKLFFSDRTLKAFHTSLKVNEINPLTVLAGVSGTGKSRLPIEYAKAMGMYPLIVSVQPRWDSPQDLFGFYNYLEHKYKATDLARALVRMDRYNFKPGDFPSLRGQKRDERMLLVLLDEMNLARIEYYFSEFLSKLEIRQSVSNPDDSAQRSHAEIEFETGPRDDKTASFRLWVGQNVLFVGTMNEDESTRTLSDKVLDRANVLKFGRPPEEIPAAGNVGGGNPAQNGQFLTVSEWQNWLRGAPAAGNPWDGDVNNWITIVNGALDRIGRPYGYRVQQGMRAYILNYPGVDGGHTYKTAFADQMEQKVLPKLRGIDMLESASREALDEIHRVLEDLEDSPLLEAFQRSKDDASSGTFVWRGVTRPI